MRINPYAFGPNNKAKLIGSPNHVFLNRGFEWNPYLMGKFISLELFILAHVEGSTLEPCPLDYSLLFYNLIIQLVIYLINLG